MGALQTNASWAVIKTNTQPRGVKRRDSIFALGVIAMPDAIDRDDPNSVSFMDMIVIAQGIDVQECHGGS